ncbi:MAG: C-GCAxxG-C-C family protein [Gemmiger sp.]|nr:C-GCAxxG-C-C family protein [Gemmiger sp.]
MANHSELAEGYFHQGYNCSQSVAMAFAEEMGLAPATACRMVAGFGGGFGRMREVCGAFSGLVFVLGTLYGSSDPAKKTELYTAVQALAAAYKAENGRGSIVCRELLGLDAPEGSPVASPRTDSYYKKRPCSELVGIAAKILEEYIAGNPLPHA